MNHLVVPSDGGAFDRTLAEVRSKFADMPPEALEALIQEAVAAVRTGGKAESAP